MKKVICIVLCILLLASVLSGCGKTEKHEFNILDNPSVAGSAEISGDENTGKDKGGVGDLFAGGPETVVFTPDGGGFEYGSAFEYEGSIYYVDRDSNIRRASIDMSEEEIFWEHSVDWWIGNIIAITNKGMLYTNYYRIDLKTGEACQIMDTDLDSERIYEASRLIGASGEWAYFTDEYSQHIYRCRFSDMRPWIPEYEERTFLELSNLETVTDTEHWDVAFVDNYIACIFKSDWEHVYISPADGEISFTALFEGEGCRYGFYGCTSEYLMVGEGETDKSWLVSPGSGEMREFSSQLLEGVGSFTEVEIIDGRLAFAFFQDTLQWKYLDGEDYSTWNYDPANPMFEGEFAMGFDIVGDWVFVAGNTRLSPEEGSGWDFIFKLGSSDVYWLESQMGNN